MIQPWRLVVKQTISLPPCLVLSFASPLLFCQHRVPTHSTLRTFIVQGETKRETETRATIHFARITSVTFPFPIRRFDSSELGAARCHRSFTDACLVAVVVVACRVSDDDSRSTPINSDQSRRPRRAPSFLVAFTLNCTCLKFAYRGLARARTRWCSEIRLGSYSRFSKNIAYENIQKCYSIRNIYYIIAEKKGTFQVTPVYEHHSIFLAIQRMTKLERYVFTCITKWKALDSFQE